ncbi:MAG: hypothetical protein K5636_05660 [Bacteroidales bacterium]|nr:hypothetical protein [Bacteroidales bacterium]
MKKRIKTLSGKIALAMFVSVALVSCVDKPQTWKNIIVVCSNGEKTGSENYTMFVNIGHQASDCKNSCVVVSGQSIHVDCQGFGHQCNTSAAVTLQQVGTAITATTTDTFGLTNEDFFNMPARSLGTGEGGSTAYLNIPAQLVERDTATLQFTFTGLTYSAKPWYNND